MGFDFIVWGDIAKQCGLFLYKQGWHRWWWWRVEQQI
jgi:hypothetical protein